MSAPVFVVHPSQPEEPCMIEAARILRAGGLVVFPTETVYGLAADASNPQAIERLNQVKGRPPDKPYSLHVHDAAQVREYVPEVSRSAQRLMDQFWPGPLTIVMPSTRGGTMGFRLPAHPVAQAFLARCQRQVVAPSANRSGFPPPTDAKEALASMDGQFDCLLDAGPTPLGRESTVVQVIGERVEVLREGAVATAAIMAAVNS